MAAPIRIANCSGFFGDRPSAASEMVEGGPIDVLTGDWLAELTMLILARIQARRPGGGYASTFVTQMEQVMGTCLDSGIRVVSNAGGLNPATCAEAVAEVADGLGLAPSIAYIDGDDLLPSAAELVSAGSLLPLETGDLGDPSEYISANAYLGCFGIADALEGGADIVITGRVTDAALTCGPAAWHHGWSPEQFDELAGAVVAGHVIECGPQACGGNYSFFTELSGLDTLPRIGFPWAEVAEDGSSVIGKHDGTGGAVTVGTVTSQILYEIGSPEYLGPDVTARFDTIDVSQLDTDRVAISGVRGQAPPDTLKVCINELGGYRNSFTVALSGLDIDEKAAFVQAAFWDACDLTPNDFDTCVSRVAAVHHGDPPSQEHATATWRLTVKDRDKAKVGRAFTNPMVQTTLGAIPGMYPVTGGPSDASPFGVLRTASVPAELVPQHVHLGDRTVEVSSVSPPGERINIDVDPSLPFPTGPTVQAPLGRIAGARSGDKGGDANLGLFVRSEKAWAWLDHEMTIDRLRKLLPETVGLEVERYRLPRLRSLNFLIHGLLEEGVAASTRQDPQAKALGEWVRARLVSIPESLLNQDC